METNNTKPAAKLTARKIDARTYYVDAARATIRNFGGPREWLIQYGDSEPGRVTYRSLRAALADVIV